MTRCFDQFGPHEAHGRARRAVPLLVFGVLLCAGAWAFQVPLTENVTVALRDEEQSHILLAPLVALWLVWLRRQRLQGAPCRPSLAGSVMVAAGCLLSWFGFHTDTFIAWHGGAILALLGVAVTMTGLTPLRHLIPALGALAFVLPVPGTIRHSIAIPLQKMATEVTYGTLELFEFEVAKQGHLLVVNGEYIAIAEACNGMRLVFSLVLVVYAFVFTVPLRPSVRIALLAATPLIALVANLLRLIPTSILYGTTSAEVAQAFHDISGWVMLPLALAGLLGMLGVARWLELPVLTPAASPSPPPPAPMDHGSRLAPAVSLAAMLVLPQLFIHSERAPHHGPEPAVVIAAADRLPHRFGGWSGVDVPPPEPAVSLLRPNVVIARRFRDLHSGLAVTLVIVHCGDVRDMQSHYPPNCYPHAGWVPEPVSVNREGATYPPQRPDGSIPMELRLMGKPFDASLYEFSQMSSLGLRRRARVFNFFILPDGQLTGEIGRLLSRDNMLRRTLVRSAGQVQLVVDADVPIEDAVNAANEILHGVQDFFRDLGVGQHQSIEHEDTSSHVEREVLE